MDKNISKKNIHIILLESFIDPTDFTNVKIKENAIPNEWIKFKNKNKLYGISPVSGGGSAQAEFELLCGAPSIIEYGTEFNVWLMGIQVVYQITYLAIKLLQVNQCRFLFNIKRHTKVLV